MDEDIPDSGESHDDPHADITAVRACAQRLLDELDLPPYGDGAVARMRAIAATRDDVIAISEAAEALRRALEI